MLKVLDVDGAVRRVRGGWEATGQDVGLRRGALPPGDRGPRARAAGDARLPRHRPVPDALPARPARRPRGGRLRPLRQLRRARARPPTSPTARSTEADGAAGPARAWSSSRARCGRPRWPTSASTSRARSPRAPSEGRAVARLTDLGYGQALRELFAPATDDGPVPVPLVKAVIEVLGDWRPPVDGIVVVESATRPTLTADLADGLSRYLEVPVVGPLRDRRPRRRARARARRTPPSGWPRSAGGSRSRPTRPR